MHVHFVGEADDGLSVSSHHARALARAGVEVSFGADGVVDRSTIKTTDVVHLVTQEQRDNRLFRSLVGARAAGLPVVRFWTGRDVIWARHHEPTLQIARDLATLGTVQLARTPELVADLADLEITASVGPVLSMNLSDTASPQPLPKHFTVLCYLPSRERAYHGGAWVDALIHWLPNVRFLILGDSDTDYSAQKNVESLGFVGDVARTIQRSTVTIVPRIDGILSRLTLETLSHGRHAITTHPWPHCEHADSVDAFLSTIRHLSRDPQFNLVGREAVCRDYDRKVSLAAMLQLLEECGDPSSPAGKLRGGWLGVAARLRRSGILRSEVFDLPEPDDLPPEASALRVLLTAQPQERPALQGEAS